MSASALQVFLSVFPAPSDIETPTPTTTPVPPSSSTFEEPRPPKSKAKKISEPTSGSAAEQIKWDRAWHHATIFLSLPAEPVQASEGEEAIKQRWCSKADTETMKALEYLLDENSKGRRMRAVKNPDLKGENLLRWYFESQIVGHFLGQMKPLLLNMLWDSDEMAVEGLFNVGRHLYLAQTVYMWPIKQYMSKFLGDGAEMDVRTTEHDLHGIYMQLLPKNQIEQGLRQFFRHQASIILNVNLERYAPKYTAKAPLSSAVISREREKTKDWLLALKGVGLGSHQAQVIFAEVMDEILGEYVKVNFSRRWESPSENAAFLNNWIVGPFTEFIANILELLLDVSDQELQEIVTTYVETWKDMGLKRLGSLRTEELFNIVIEWDDNVHGAIEDLRAFITDAPTRAYFTNSFFESINKRLLQPAAATLDIIQVYISVIRAFTLLDHKGVLLDRVARPIRRYLREREDTVAIVVGGLLADPENASEDGESLVELAIQMSNQKSLADSEDAASDLDYDDMEWVPDPIDAGPDFRKLKHSDVIGSLISLFESKDIFIKEFQNILGERLLRKEYEFEREVRVLELLKVRFGEAAIQSCEVMLRDILDSRRLDTAISRDPNLSPAPSTTELHTRVLSHLYWPSLHEESFELPSEIALLQERYAAGFETIKQNRKLTWLNALGQVTVRLELEDRTIEEEAQTWHASVIYAFQSTDDDDPSKPITRTVPELMEKLQMSENFVNNALTFWVGKLVMKSLPSPPHPPRSFTVLETLADEAAAQEGTTSAAIAAAAETVTSAAAPAVLNEHEVVEEKMGVFAQYVVGMLTNGGPMPLQQIIMMLKLTVPGGFPFGNEELKGFLEGEVREGKLDYSGGSYRIKR